MKTDSPATDTSEYLLIGWSQTDITPALPAAVGGMQVARLAKVVADPLTATALALEAPYQKGDACPLVLVSCDLRNISEPVLTGLRELLKKNLPDVPSENIILNGTHTHTAPPLSKFDLPLEGWDEPDYVQWVVPVLAKLICNAWESRKPGGFSFGLSHAVIGHNRIMAYYTGKSKMGGGTNKPEFSHVEGYEDPAMQLLCTWTPEGELTGMIVNVTSTSQVSQAESIVSADYWHEARVEIRRRFGNNLYILPQCSAAGDQMSRPTVYKRAEARMQELTGRTYRQEIGVRLANAVGTILPVLKDHVDWKPELAHRSEILGLTRRMISEKDLEEAEKEASPYKAAHEKAVEEFSANPKLIDDLEWLTAATKAFWQKNRAVAVKKRLETQKKEPTYPAELHVIRIGDTAIATNPFELYLDYGIQIKGRSTPVQTFVVELAGAGSYIPTARSIAGGAYGAVPASTNVGPEGGKELVYWTVKTINSLWPEGA